MKYGGRRPRKALTREPLSRQMQRPESLVVLQFGDLEVETYTSYKGRDASNEGLVLLQGLYKVNLRRMRHQRDSLIIMGFRHFKHAAISKWAIYTTTME